MKKLSRYIFLLVFNKVLNLTVAVNYKFFYNLLSIFLVHFIDLENQFLAIC